MSATPEELTEHRIARDNEVQRLIGQALEGFYAELDNLIRKDAATYAEIRNQLFTLDAEEIVEDYADWVDDE